MTRKTTCFEGWSWFKFNNLELALGTNLKFDTSVAKWLKLIVRMLGRPISTFVEVRGEKLVEEPFGRGSFRLGHATKTNCIKFLIVDPEICSSLILYRKIWD